MIDWIHDGCKHWGHQIRILYLGKDGWPPRTILDKMIKEGVLGASANQFTQFFPECLDEEAVRWNNAIKSLEEEHRNRLFIHYCVIGKGKVKAARMSESRTVYYDRLDLAHKKVSGALHKLGEAVRKKIADAGQNSQICRQSSALESANLQAA